MYKNGKAKIWSTEEIKKIIELAPDHDRAEIAKIFNISTSSLSHLIGRINKLGYNLKVINPNPYQVRRQNDDNIRKAFEP